MDIPINFITAYEDEYTTLPVVDLKSIANNYLKGWFFIDFLTVLPVDFIENLLMSSHDGMQSFENDSKNIKLARLARIPRIYKIVRILKVSKMFKVAKKGTY